MLTLRQDRWSEGSLATSVKPFRRSGPELEALLKASLAPSQAFCQRQGWQPRPKPDGNPVLTVALLYTPQVHGAVLCVDHACEQTHMHIRVEQLSQTIKTRALDVAVNCRLDEHAGSQST
jgi:hypothetical protein